MSKQEMVPETKIGKEAPKTFTVRVDEIMKDLFEKDSRFHIENVSEFTVKIAEETRTIEDPELLSRFVFDYSYENFPGFFSGITEMFASVAENENTQLPDEIKEMFSSVDSIKERLKNILENAYDKKLCERIEESHYNNSAEYIHKVYSDNKFQRE